MPEQTTFPHLRLSEAIHNTARPRPSGRSADEHPRTFEHKANPVQHSSDLLTSVSKVVRAWRSRRGLDQGASAEGLTTQIARAGVPLLLEVEDSTDVDWLRTAFGFEIVSEEEEGFVIVAAQDIELSEFAEKIGGFGQGESRTGMVAKLYSVEENDDNRLKRILSDELFQQWRLIEDEGTYTVDIGLSCASQLVLPPKVRRQKDESGEHFQTRFANYRTRRDAVQMELDDFRIEAENNFESFMRAYNTTSHLGYMDSNKVPVDAEFNERSEEYGGDEEISEIWDSFTTRMTLPGKALRDLVHNYPYVFEVSLPDYGSSPLPVEGSGAPRDDDGPELVPLAPADSAPAVCVIDSGIQEQHRLLARAIDSVWSYCYIPGKATDVADYVQNGGHGTRVAGLILYPDGVPLAGEYQLPFWIQNARILDENNRLAINVQPWKVLPNIVSRFIGSPRHTRLYNHSITGAYPHRSRHMSAWAAAIDELSFSRDVLFLQAAGNLQTTSIHPFLLGVREHIEQGETYPEYLRSDLCRLPSPSQSLQAITVGSVIRESLNDGNFVSFGSANNPSSYSKTGLGIWGTIKPDVVEYGGDFAHDGEVPPNIRVHESLAPETLRSTLSSSAGPDRARDAVGTSFSAPLVSHIAARLQDLLPTEPCLLYRALIAQSAQWPAWTNRQTDKEHMCNILRHIGYGIPDLNRATSNDEYRATMITSGEQQIQIGNAHIYEIKIPDSLRDPGEDHDIRIEICLSYSALPRRTRRNLRGYLAARVEWETIHLDETIETFKKRIFDEEEKAERTTKSLNWFFQRQVDKGKVHGTSRNHATLQKDWATVKSSRLPATFAVAVIGRRGWTDDPDTFAKYALAITFEAINQDIEVYEPIKAVLTSEIAVEVPQIQTELQLETSV